MLPTICPWRRTHFSHILASIKKLETDGLALTESIQIMKKIGQMNVTLSEAFPHKYEYKE